jgi:hypothetical protein
MSNASFNGDRKYKQELTRYDEGTFPAPSRCITALSTVALLHDATIVGHCSEYGQRRTKHATDGTSHPLPIEASVNNTQP